MRISLALGPRQPLSRQAAWGCLTANLALPGSGSLLGGRISGYVQLVLSLAGFAATFVFGLQFIAWFFRNYSRLQQIQGTDPVGYMMEVWHAIRWSLLGMGLFGVAWLWALGTSLLILAASREAERKAALLGRIPPKIKP